MNLPALQRSLADVVAEYDHKVATLPDAITAFEKAGQDMSLAASTVCVPAKTLRRIVRALAPAEIRIAALAEGEAVEIAGIDRAAMLWRTFRLSRRRPDDDDDARRHADEGLR